MEFILDEENNYVPKNHEGFYGIDASIEISWGEYNLICKDIEGGIQYVYRVNDEYYNTGLWSKNDTLEIINGPWFEKKSFLSYIGCKESDFLNDSLINQLFGLISYYGYQSIIGCDVYSF